MSLADWLLKERTPKELAKELAAKAHENAALKNRVHALEYELFWKTEAITMTNQATTPPLTGAELDKPAFEVWAREACNMPPSVPLNWDAVWTKSAYEGWQAAALIAQARAQQESTAAPMLPIGMQNQAAFREACKKRGVSPSQATFELWQDARATLAQQSSQPPAPVVAADYQRNVLESCANWLDSRSHTVWAEERGYGGLMRGYAADLRGVRAALSAPPAPMRHAPADDCDHSYGKADERCPECGEFKQEAPEAAHADDLPAPKFASVMAIADAHGSGAQAYTVDEVHALLAHAQQDAAPAEPDGFVAAVGAWVSARDYWQDDEHECVKRTWADLLRFAASAPSDATGKAEDLAGRVVSVDVSTGDDDYANRIFAKLTGETGSDGTTLLAIETERNFGATGEAVAANAGVDYEEIADMVDSLVITNQRKYMKGNVAYELDQFAARIRKMASQAPAATSAADAKDADRDMGEPTMLWDADDPEDGTHGDSPQDFAENYACNSGMTGEILVDVLCAYRGGKRTMRITVADDCTVSWSWANRCAAIAATQQAAPGNKTQSAPAEKAAVQETAKPILWAALNLNGQIVYLNANRENVEYNRRFIKTPTRIVGLVVQERATAVGADAQAQSSEQQAEKGEPNVG